MKLVIQPTLLLKTPNYHQRTLDLTHIGNLLRSVDQGRTLAAAAKDLNVSYRTVWNELREAEQELGCKLLERIKGHGSKITPAGQLLIHSLDRLDLQLSNETQRLAADIGEKLSKHLEKILDRYIFCTSNDPLIEQIHSKFDEIDYKTMGSGHALDRLIENKASIAGFHVSDPAEIKAIEDHLRRAGLVTVPLMQRVQGLLLAKGNPLKIQSIRDLARPEVRMINRQKGAGTRLLLDRLLEREGLKTKLIKGYGHEEFTHSAVATSILAEQADVGIGLQYIAKEYKLHFIPLETETFYLAMKPEFRRNKTLIAFIKAIQNRSNKTPGYKALK
ncbi:MAG: substrate-binding domain-containing protein [Polynucleobacter sp.]|uniref:substrate-binding domain-containing protein n=1 Tax=Polynucleobacter sp. HIN8 TaxID=3047867 RepID=UPI002573B69B|nr:substrate-binding domain-containing protein [Polynucleobacter sp. HIN8]BEI38795.1 substrate-binding domain-containing protein [Polynucleobacter sp. HIN8]